MEKQTLNIDVVRRITKAEIVAQMIEADGFGFTTDYAGAFASVASAKRYEFNTEQTVVNIRAINKQPDTLIHTNLILHILEDKPCQYCNHTMTDDLLKLNEAYHRIGQECTVDGCTCGHWLLVADTNEVLPFGKLETIQEVA